MTELRRLQESGLRVLLFADTDPGVPGVSWWVTPGGGIDPGETPEAAGLREQAAQWREWAQAAQSAVTDR